MNEKRISRRVAGIAPSAIHEMTRLAAQVEDVAFLYFKYPGSIMAHAHVSWLDPNKIRKTTVVGSKKMLVYDDVSMTEKIRVYDKGVTVQPHYDTFGEFQLSYRTGDIVSPKIDTYEPLAVEVDSFLQSIRTGRQIWRTRDSTRLSDSAAMVNAAGIVISVLYKSARS